MQTHKESEKVAKMKNVAEKWKKEFINLLKNLSEWYFQLIFFFGEGDGRNFTPQQGKQTSPALHHPPKSAYGGSM